MELLFILESDRRYTINGKNVKGNIYVYRFILESHPDYGKGTKILDNIYKDFISFCEDHSKKCFKNFKVLCELPDYVIDISSGLPIGETLNQRFLEVSRPRELPDDFINDLLNKYRVIAKSFGLEDGDKVMLINVIFTCLTYNYINNECLKFLISVKPLNIIKSMSEVLLVDEGTVMIRLADRMIDTCNVLDQIANLLLGSIE